MKQAPKVKLKLSGFFYLYDAGISNHYGLVRYPNAK